MTIRASALVVVPTLNERENIRPLLGRLRALPIEVDVLVVDDNSPDGTWELVRDLAREDTRLHLLHRQGLQGRGLAGRDGFIEALRMGAQRIVEMDADLSHDPVHIPAMLNALERYDVVLGSRGIDGGSDADRGIGRKTLTIAANSFTRVVLGLRVRDCNSGFRAYRRSAMEAIDPISLKSFGPAIVQEVLYRAHRAKLDIGEIPIRFVNRRVGTSHLTFGKLLTGYLTVLRLRIEELLPKRNKS
ncbi:MAG: dolichyl-phosphate beta-D-mannosyltransferase [Gemmatimonadetes bacterium]|nr:dolichyl-phosphate beta-D-mannosyltransferase [Gemmatimonadota bacterium]